MVRKVAGGVLVVSIVSAVACQRGVRADPAGSAGPAVPALSDVSYRAEIQKFREAREAALKTDTGWLTIAGLFFLTKPETSFGSDPANDIVLPAGAPAHAGTFALHDGKVAVTAASGVGFVLNRQTVTNASLKSDAIGSPDRIGLQDLTLWVHQSGDRLAIRLRDKNNHLRKEFAGLSWYPVNEVYRVDGEFVPYDTPKTVQIPNILGDLDAMLSPGLATLSIDGQRLQMVAIIDPDHDKELWFIFRDLTTGAETDPAARFLYTPLPVNGKLTLDFNRAQNPPCAYNAFATCPLPPQENRLPVRVEAGEKNYAHRP
jgi:uncharacterized protein (DUF1684 family)